LFGLSATSAPSQSAELSIASASELLAARNLLARELTAAIRSAVIDH